MASESISVDLRKFRFLKEVSLVADGETMFTFALGEAFEVKNGTLIVKGESDLHRKDGLVGMSGAYFDPSLLSASSVDEVFDAWTWIGEKVGNSFHQMSAWLTGVFVLRAILGGPVNFAVVTPMEVAVKLYKLSRSIDTNPKIHELKQAIRGNVKSWTRDKTVRWYKNVEQMVGLLSNLSSEFDFALFSLECGLPVKLARRPDMYVAEISVDVKSLSWDPSIGPHKYTRKIIDRASKAFQRQHAELAGLSIGLALVMLGLVKRRTSRVGRKGFCVALKNGLVLAGDRRKPVLLFYHDPWTGDVQAITETLENLRKSFSRPHAP